MSSDSRFLDRSSGDPFRAWFSVLVVCVDTERRQVQQVVEGVADQVRRMPPDPRATHEREGSAATYIAVDGIPQGIQLDIEFDVGSPDDQERVEPLLRQALDTAGLAVELVEPPKPRGFRSFGETIWCLWVSAPFPLDAGTLRTRRVPQAWTDEVADLLADPPPELEFAEQYWTGRWSLHESSPQRVRERLASWVEDANSEPANSSLAVGRGDDRILLSCLSPFQALVIGMTDDRIDPAILTEWACGLDPVPEQAMVAPMPSRDPWYHGPTAWSSADGAYHNHGFVACYPWADYLLNDAGWWTMVGPGHIDRLRRAGADEVLDRLEPLDTSTDAPRWALTIGEPVDWLPDNPRASSRQEEAREIIRPLLYTLQERRALKQRSQNR